MVILDAPITDGIDELLEREGRIERAQRNAYYEIGLDLGYIRDKQLYKVERPEPIAGRYSFQTFEEYVENCHEMDVSSAKHLILAAEAASKLVPIGTVFPARESHVRPLLRLESDAARAEVWQAVVERGESENGRKYARFALKRVPWPKLTP